MKMEQSHTYEKVILAIELGGFAVLLSVLWLDEYLDVPFRFLGALKTPLRPQEFWFEAITTLLVASTVIAATLWVFRRLRILESFIQICAWCRKVKVDDEWVSFEQYLKREHEVLSTHGICPDCRANATKPTTSRRTVATSADRYATLARIHPRPNSAQPQTQTGSVAPPTAPGSANEI